VNSRWNIVIVEDDPQTGAFYRATLKSAGYKALLFTRPAEFFTALAKAKPDAAFIELKVPGMDGKDVIRVLRANEATRRMLLIGLSRRPADSKEAIGVFNAGADEYLSSPADPEFVLVRLASLLQRRLASPAKEEPIVLGELSVLPDERVCRLAGKALKLTRIEFDLLVYFLRQRGRILTRGQLLKDVWQGDPVTGTATVDKHVENLRRKLGLFGARIETVIKLGYVLKA